MKLIDGYTYMHEHMTIDLSGVKKDEDCHLDCYEETVKELKKLYHYGVRNIVEVSNIGMGRDIDYIQRIEKETGIQILKSTGWYKEPFIPEEYLNKTTEELASIMIDEIENGIEGTDVKAMMIGEIGTSKNEWKDSERRLFDAAIIAHKKTNRPIYTHTTLSTLALEQAKYLVSHGVDPHRIVIGHVDLCEDINYIKEVLKTGVTIGFDTIGKNNYLPDEKRIAHLLELEKTGYTSQVVLSEDLTRKSHLAFKGGIGYAYLFESFLPAARKSGISESFITDMLVNNPKRIME
jgi:phosphotriesterase-related protein